VFCSLEAVKLDKKTKKLANQVRRELRAIRRQVMQKRSKEALKIYRKLASTLE